MDSLHRQWLEESGQLHAPAAVLPRKGSPVPLNRKLRCLQDQCVLWSREKSRPQPETQLRFFAFSCKGFVQWHVVIFDTEIFDVVHRLRFETPPMIRRQDLPPSSGGARCK
jgi:hypothetical protein